MACVRALGDVRLWPAADVERDVGASPLNSPEQSCCDGSGEQVPRHVTSTVGADRRNRFGQFPVALVTRFVLVSPSKERIQYSRTYKMVTGLEALPGV